MNREQRSMRARTELESIGDMSHTIGNEYARTVEMAGHCSEGVA